MADDETVRRRVEGRLQLEPNSWWFSTGLHECRVKMQEEVGDERSLLERVLCRWEETWSHWVAGMSDGAS